MSYKYMDNPMFSNYVYLLLVKNNFFYKPTTVRRNKITNFSIDYLYSKFLSYIVCC